jgi:hypothetical protein
LPPPSSPPSPVIYLIMCCSIVVLSPLPHPVGAIPPTASSAVIIVVTAATANTIIVVVIVVSTANWLLCHLLPLCLPLHCLPSAFVSIVIVQLSMLLLPAAVPMLPAACASASHHATSCWLLSSGASSYCLLWLVVASSFFLHFVSTPPLPLLELSSSDVNNPFSSLSSLPSPFVVAHHAGHKPLSAFDAPINCLLLCCLLPLCLTLHCPPSAFVSSAIVQSLTLLLPAVIPMLLTACASASRHATSCWILSPGASSYCLLWLVVPSSFCLHIHLR